MKRKSLFIPLGILFSSLFILSSCSRGDDTYPSNQTDSASVKNGVTYNFYYSHASTNLLYSITGKPGDQVPNLPVPKRKFYTFDSWKTDDGSEIPANFGTTSLEIYAQWTSTTQIGNKIKPSVVGDIVFTDGSATSYTDAIATPLTDDQKKNVAAIIFTTSYNLENGDNKNGSTMLGIAVYPKHTNWCADRIKVGNDNDLLSLYAGYDLQNITNDNQPANALSFNLYDGSKNLPKTDQLLAYSYYYAPAFYYAYTYGTNAVDMKEEYRDGWYLPSYYEMRILMTEEGLLSTIKSVFSLTGKTFDVNSNTTATNKSTLILTSYSDTSAPDSANPNDEHGYYSESDMWVTIRMYDITAEPKMRTRTPRVNPKESYKKAAIYTKAYAVDFQGEVNLVTKTNKAWDKDNKPTSDNDAPKKSYAFPVRVFK